MNKSNTKKKVSNSAARVTRSISFKGFAMDHLRKKAKAENRSVNYLVNQLVENDLRHAGA